MKRLIYLAVLTPMLFVGCSKKQDANNAFIIFVFISDSDMQHIRDGCAVFF